MDFLNSRINVLLSLVVVLVTVAIAEAKPKALLHTDIALATFNVKWFGLGGSKEGSAEKEKRDVTLKKFIAEEILPTDLIVFQEVVDVPRLLKLLPAKWNCQTYDNPEPTHQHVVLCASEKYKLKLVDYDTNNTIETVAINGDKSRPAVRMNVTNVQGKVLFALVGVHLKAYPEESKTREFQAGEIAKDLSRLDSDIPVVITGDFNTYPAEKTGGIENDIDLLESSLNQMGAEFIHVPMIEENTYRSGRYGSQFDHYYVKGDMNLVTAPDVYDVCNSTSNGQGFMNLSYYNKNVSDHCPVKLKISIPDDSAR